MMQVSARVTDDKSRKAGKKPEETLINSEFPQHKDVLPFSMTNKSLKMRKKGEITFSLFRALIIHGRINQSFPK